MVATDVAATRAFEYVDGPMGVPQLCGFWDKHTAVLFGTSTDEFRPSQVGLAAVLTDHPAFGPALSSHVVPEQSDLDAGPYGEPAPCNFVAFCPISQLQAILVTTVVLLSAANSFGVVGEKSEVVYHLMQRETVTSYDFTITKSTLSGVAWSWPDGAVDFGSGSADDYAIHVLQAVVGSETSPVGLTASMTSPGPSHVVDYMGPISISGSITIDLTTGFDDPGPYGSTTTDTGQAAVLHGDGNFELFGAPDTGAGIVNRTVASGLAHCVLGNVHSPQIVGAYTTGGTGITDGTGGIIAWAEILGGTSVAFHSTTVASPSVPTYGAPVALPTGVVGDLVAVTIASGVTKTAYVPVTLVVSNAARDDASWDYSGTATVYGAVVDFRSGLLRSDWVVLGAWNYQNMPGKPLISVTDVADTEIDIAWTEVTGGSGGIIYDVYRSGTLVASDLTALAYADTGRAPSTAYEYVVVAHDSGGNYGPFSERLGVNTTGPSAPPDTTPPSAPVLTVVGTTAHSVTFTALASDDVAVSFYRFFLTGHDPGSGLVDDSGSPETPLSVVLNTDGSYTVDWSSVDTGPGTHEPYFCLDNEPHYYCVRAYDTSGNEGPRSTYGASGQITLGAVNHPTQTGAPFVTGTTGTPFKTGITFTWGVSTNSVGGGSTGIVVDIYRSGVLHDTVPATTTSYTDSFVAHSHPTYSLQARNTAGWKSLLQGPVPDWVTLGD